jgi:hypothetical protein
VALAVTGPLPQRRGGSPDAVAAVALALSSGGLLAVTAPAESALEFAREEYTAGPFVHTPAYCYDPDDLNFGFDEIDDQTCLGGGDWGDFVDDSGG